MRRTDREMDRSFALQVVDNAPYGILSINDLDGCPYGIPLSIARKDNALYFHSAKSGKKVDAIIKNTNVCVTFVGAVQVPDLFSDEKLGEMMHDGTTTSTLTTKVFTTQFESAMIFGSISLVEDQQESIEAMRLICEKYTPSKMAFFDKAIEHGMKQTNMYKITIDEITGKRKKFDSSGEEMKWGRMQ